MIVKGNVFALINTNYKAFTKSEKIVADLVLSDGKRILYNSITDLAEEAKVGETTVLRFCRKLGFDGYQGFKMRLAQSIQEDDSKNILSDEITKDDTVKEVCSKVLATNIAALNETFELMDYNALEKTVNFLVNSKRIVFFGIGSSSLSAQEARNKFMRIIPHVESVIDSHMQSMMASLMDKDETAIAFSYSGSSKDTIECLKIAKEAGARTVCITRYAKSPITQYSDVVLLVGAKEGPLQGGALSTKMAQLYLIDIIYAEYFKRTMELALNNKKKTTEAVSNKLY